eukprot:sb/3464074/
MNLSASRLGHNSFVPSLTSLPPLVQMQELINKYIELSKQDPEAEPSWQVLSKSGETKIYRKEEQKGDVLMDFLVATTLVEGVTAAEMTEVFHSKELKLKWDHTIEGDKLLETLDDHCAVYHQILKRVWPAAQRDLVYASHKQQHTQQAGRDIISRNQLENPGIKEEQKGDVLMDFLVATTLVEDVTAAEMTEVFHSKELKLKWDHTIEGDKLLETLDDHCAVYHQILKRVWPAAQRDLVYASHKQQLEAQSGEDNPSWIVCNVSCDHPSKPESSSSYTRASIEVVMFCQTIGKGPSRKDVKCKIVYSASVNPGGWAPSAAVRAVSQREYPKFLKKISAFAIDHVKNNPVKEISPCGSNIVGDFRGVNINVNNQYEPTEASKQPIRTRDLGHVTGYQPIRDQYFLNWSIPGISVVSTPTTIKYLEVYRYYVLFLSHSKIGVKIITPNYHKYLSLSFYQLSFSLSPFSSHNFLSLDSLLSLKISDSINNQHKLHIPTHGWN